MEYALIIAQLMLLDRQSLLSSYVVLLQYSQHFRNTLQVVL
jgi:hypothetical protein